MGTMNATDHLQTELLVSQYRQGVSASALARANEVSAWSIITRLRAAGVEVRSPKEQNARHLGVSTASFSFREVVDGLMLGDGQIDKKAVLHLEQCYDRLGWVEQVQSHLFKTGCASRLLPIPSRVRRIEGRKVVSKPATHLYTPSYEELHVGRARWYPKGGKRIPQDLTLTAISLLHWFCGDGSHDGKGHLVFYTNGFVEQDVEFLVTVLGRDLGVLATKTRSSRVGQYVVQVHRHDEAMKIKALLLPLIDKSCEYKLCFVRPKKRQGKFSDAEVSNIRRLRAEGKTLPDLAETFQVSTTAVSNIVNRKAYRSVT